MIKFLSILTYIIIFLICIVPVFILSVIIVMGLICYFIYKIIEDCWNEGR
jgi:hypothetical protein